MDFFDYIFKSVCSNCRLFIYFLTFILIIIIICVDKEVLMNLELAQVEKDVQVEVDKKVLVDLVLMEVDKELLVEVD